MKPSILFITTSSLAANPRLVKEFSALKQVYNCQVICFRHKDWSETLSDKIIASHDDVHFTVIDRKKSLFQTILAKLYHKAAILINPFFKSNYKICAFASNDKTPQLVFKVNQLKRRVQFQKVIAHNLGAFYPAYSLAKFQKIGLQLDIEDFYPGEALYFNKGYEEGNRHLIMQKSFDYANTITYAAKGIKIECNKRYASNKLVQHETVINAFNSLDFLKPLENTDNVIKCIWFSQNIGPNRGLEQVFETAKSHSEIEFHLIGNKNEDYLKTIDLSSNIIFHNVLPQEELHQLLSTMDIGLALESKNADLNRDICLTNKFLAYAQAGLYILATDTFGQRDFLDNLDYDAGELINTGLGSTLSELEDIKLDIDYKIKRWNKAKSFSWEKEQQKLISLMQ